MSADESEKRESVSVNLTPTAKKMVEAWRDETGIPKTEALERLLLWYFAQPESVRAAILARKFNPAAQVEGADFAALRDLSQAIAARLDVLIAEQHKRGGPAHVKQAIVPSTAQAGRRSVK